MNEIERLSYLNYYAHVWGTIILHVHQIGAIQFIKQF